MKKSIICGISIFLLLVVNVTAYSHNSDISGSATVYDSAQCVGAIFEYDGTKDILLDSIISESTTNGARVFLHDGIYIIGNTQTDCGLDSPNVTSSLNNNIAFMNNYTLQNHKNYTLLMDNGVSSLNVHYYVISPPSQAVGDTNTTFNGGTSTGNLGILVPTVVYELKGINFDEVNFYLYNINCTSCNPPLGSIVTPYITDDTTPTFTFNSMGGYACRISDQNINYTAMGSSRDCDYGLGVSSHTCTLTAQDGLVDYNTSVYIGCNYNESANSSYYLPMLISSLETPNSTEAIQQGIENSVIGTGATIYTNQKVYLRALNGSTFTNTVDKVAVYGNQRWIFSYENTTALGLFNLSPVVYSLDMVNMSIKAIRANVTALINSTKS